MPRHLVKKVRITQANIEDVIEGSVEPVHPRCLARAFTVRSRNIDTDNLPHLWPFWVAANVRLKDFKNARDLDHFQVWRLSRSPGITYEPRHE